MKKHILKTDPTPFQQVWDYKKLFEIRLNDRGFEVGDELVLRETRHTGEEMKNGAPLEYTQRCALRIITHIMQGPVYGLQEGWCIMSMEDIAHTAAFQILQERSRPLADHAESLLCNAVPMAHCTQEEWDKIIHDWRDEKYRLYPDGIKAEVPAPTGEGNV